MNHTVSPDPERPVGDVELCIVSPCYNEERNVEPFHDAVAAALSDTGVTWNFLFVDDGSKDRTAEILAALRRRDPRVGYIRLTRNFGLQSALAAGLQHATGRAVVVMDADLQDDPAALPRFVEEWRRGADVVYAVRSKRKEGVLKRALFKAFYWTMTLLAEIPIPREAGSFALYDRRVVDRINALPERNRYLPGLRAWVGFRQVPVAVPRHERHAGEPAQSMLRLFALAFDGVFAFSKAPLRLASILGLTVTALSLIALTVVLYWRFVERSFPSGVGLATIALALLFLGGVQLLVTGIIGEYLGRVYDEVKHRPNFLVMESCPPAAEPVSTDAART
ncbi:MAG TPA: glycosyltransferase family 2 protein [Longimicrobiales bacterium]|nr:glycosyltransferase family 2 protein [Longimicrobiales bacterium]